MGTCGAKGSGIRKELGREETDLEKNYSYASSIGPHYAEDAQLGD